METPFSVQRGRNITQKIKQEMHFAICSLKLVLGHQNCIDRRRPVRELRARFEPMVVLVDSQTELASWLAS